MQILVVAPNTTNFDYNFGFKEREYGFGHNSTSNMQQKTTQFML